MTIQEIMDAPIAGNAYHDQQLMDQIHVFVANESNEMQDRCLALLKLDQVMGEVDVMPTEEDVFAYLEDA